MPKRLALAFALGLLAMACTAGTDDWVYVKVGDQEWTIAPLDTRASRIVVQPRRSRERELSDIAGTTKTEPPESEAAAAVAEYLKTRRGCAVDGPLKPMGERDPAAVGWMPSWIVTLKCSP